MGLPSRPPPLLAALVVHWAEHALRQRRTEAVAAAADAAGPASAGSHRSAEAAASGAAGQSAAEAECSGSDVSEGGGSDVCGFLSDLEGSDSDSDSDAGPPPPGGLAAPNPAGANTELAARLVRLYRLKRGSTPPHMILSNPRWRSLKVRLYRAAHGGRPPRVLDVGCGDGALLALLHEREGVPWAGLAGLTADAPTKGWDLRRPLAEGGGGRPTCVAVADFERPPAPTDHHHPPLEGAFNWGARFDLVVASNTFHHRLKRGDHSLLLRSSLTLRGPLLRFDLVVSFNTFHHLLDPLGAVATAFSLLAPHGVIALDGVPIDTLRLPRRAGAVEGAAEGETCAADVLAVRALAARMRGRGGGARVGLVLDAASVSRDWVRRGRVMWLQQRWRAEPGLEQGSSLSAPPPSSIAGFVSYDAARPVVQRFGSPRAGYVVGHAGGAHPDTPEEGSEDAGGEDGGGGGGEGEGGPPGALALVERWWPASASASASASAAPAELDAGGKG
jgi:SAM-dependent methyltransferase